MSGFATARVCGHLVHEVLVHDDLAAMRIEVTLGELDRLAEHDPHIDLGDGEEGELLEGLSDEVAVLHEGLEGQLGEGTLEVLLAFGSRVDDDGICSERYGDIGLSDDGGHEGF